MRIVEPSTETISTTICPDMNSHIGTVPSDVAKSHIAFEQPMPKRHQEKKDNVFFILVAVCILLVEFFQIYSSAYNSDLWFILATGRDIVENGFPYVNTFAYHADMGIVIQQWIPDVISYGVYSIAGMNGIATIMGLLVALLSFSFYKLGKCELGRFGGEIGLLIVCILFPLVSSYVSSRPQIWSMIAFCWVLIICETYRKNENSKILIWLPIIVFLHVNIHAAMAPLDIGIVALYAIPVTGAGKIGFYCSDYPRKPVVIAIILMCVAIIINPYGINGALYLVNSYGTADYSNYILEMGALSPFSSGFGVLVIAFTIFGALALGFGMSKCDQKITIDFPLGILFIVTAFLSYQHVRNCWLIGIFAFPLICRMLSGASLFRPYFIERKAAKSTFFNLILTIFSDTFELRTIPIVAIIVITFTLVPMHINDFSKIDADSSSTPSAAMDYIDAQTSASGTAKQDVKIFNFFNPGGYIEWRGYKVFMDQRPELWAPAITGQSENYYTEFVDFALGKTSCSVFMSEYDFDYLIVDTKTDLSTYLSGISSDYHIAKSCNGYDLWEKNSDSWTSYLDSQQSADSYLPDLSNSTQFNSSDISKK